jgi:hypothetical protein
MVNFSAVMESAWQGREKCLKIMHRTLVPERYAD